MKNHKFPWIFITVLAGILFAAGSALAAWNVSEYAINLLSMTSYKNSIDENYNRPDHVDPGQKVVKEVYIKNEGDVDSFVRVKIRRTFGNSSDAGGFAEEPGLDPEMIEIHYNTDLWKYEDDGYWYYKDVLRAGKSTEKPLMDSYYLSEKADNRYKNKEARIIVNLESIQAEGGEMKNIWGKEEKDLGIRYQPCTCETVTSVVFDQNHRLTIGGESTDLFANFKNLQPGCSRSQTIRLSNTSDNTIRMYLRAEPTKQDQNNLEQIQQLLSRYGIIEIRENGKVLYQGSVDGNLTGTGWNMKKDIDLGIFGPGQGRNLVVKLSVDENMDNEYEELLGKVKWVFSAQGEAGDSHKEQSSSGMETSREDTGESQNGRNNTTGKEPEIYATASSSPKTGDETRIVGKWFALFAALVAMIMIGRKQCRKERNT
ncbi:hypothetical protein ACTQWG_16870 [Blautia sp. HCP3S3_H10_1]|uniref:hypothetical protein n=1 Tax=unclassified Blautia TaxID=2648079 RepID=UPI003F8F316F|nr:hypothetical protein [Clostridia bacterium]